jgi:hypothetical protein
MRLSCFIHRVLSKIAGGALQAAVRAAVSCTRSAVSRHATGADGFIVAGRSAKRGAAWLTDPRGGKENGRSAKTPQPFLGSRIELGPLKIARAA